jgi:predicted RecA/RadA family phage recombinase
MSKREISSGDVVEVVLAANVASGDIVLCGTPVTMFGVAEKSGVIGDIVAIRCGGIHEFPKSTATGEVFALGANVYWDLANTRATISATANTRLGVAVAAATPNTVTTVRVRLNPSF